MADIQINQLAATSSNTLTSNMFGDHFLYSVNRETFTKVSSQVVYDKEFKSLLFNEDSLYIISGTDSGLLPAYIKKQGIPNGTHYLFVELEDILAQLHQYSLIENDPEERIHFSIPKDWEEKAQDLKIREYSYLRNVSLQKAICAQLSHIPEYTELNWELAATLENLHFQYTSSLGCKFFLKRQIQNLADNVLPAKILADRYKDKTGIVLAGGPSLSDILPWVKQNRSKLVIFSVSRISKILLDNQIEPDIVVSVDPQAENIDVSKEMFFFKNSIFVHSYHIDPSLTNQWPGQKFYLGNRLPWKSKNSPENFQSAASTVSNSALSIAQGCGCRRVLLAGLDLCLSKEGITHTAGSDEADLGPNYNTSLLELETYSGEKRSSDPDFAIALRNLNAQAEKFAKENKEVINLAQHAAKAENIKHIPPESISFTEQDAELSVSPPQPLDCVTPKKLHQYYDAILTELQHAIFQIKSILKLAQKALKINESMYNERGEIENYKDKRDLDKIEQQLKKKHKNFSLLVKSFGVESFIRITSPHDDLDSWTAEKAKQIGKIYYESFQTGAQELLALIDDSIARIKARQEELQDAPDFSLLLEQWKKDCSFHRAYIWKSQHPDYQLANDIAQQFEELENQFQTLLKATETRFKAKIKNNSSLPLLKTKASLLFNHRKKEELENLSNGLKLHHAPDSQKAPYEALLKGYIADLSQDIEKALQYYNIVIDSEETSLWEEALLRITSLSIEQDDHDNALLALRCLSELSPIYLPYYAEACRISGNMVEAIDSYNKFIGFFPDDTVSKLQLTHLYMEIKVYDAAEMMIDHLLSHNPSMDAAQQLKLKITALKNTA